MVEKPSYHCGGCGRGTPRVHGLHIQDVPLLLFFVQLRSGLNGSTGAHGEQVRVRLQSVGHVEKVTSGRGLNVPHRCAHELVLRKAEVIGGAPKGHALRQVDNPQVDDDLGCR